MSPTSEDVNAGYPQEKKGQLRVLCVLCVGCFVGAVDSGLSSSLYHDAIDQQRLPTPAAASVGIRNTISVVVVCLLMKHHHQPNRHDSHSVSLEALLGYQWL